MEHLGDLRGETRNIGAYEPVHACIIVRNYVAYFKFYEISDIRKFCAKWLPQIVTCDFLNHILFIIYWIRINCHDLKFITYEIFRSEFRVKSKFFSWIVYDIRDVMFDILFATIFIIIFESSYLIKSEFFAWDKFKIILLASTLYSYFQSGKIGCSLY